MQLFEKLFSFFVLSSNGSTEREIVMKRLIITRSGRIYISGFTIKEKPQKQRNEATSLFN
ncbi:hypothetical protein A4R26_28150 [Niastella populi]|uniref:Uncharacterized protein n=1 Tax=Niastella populi TaxID=550983 RepID=A0A1V9F3R9_9BACT|nr:hypothetical protein A4R26_28150 [Niastella populi]